jgi:hypothetical protein
MDTTRDLFRTLVGKYAAEVLVAPNTIFDPVLAPLPIEVIRPIFHLLKRLPNASWSDALALGAGVCAVRQFLPSEVVTAIYAIDRGFRTSNWKCVDDNESNGYDIVHAYLESNIANWRKRAVFLGNYIQVSYEIHNWYNRLSREAAQAYYSLIFPFNITRPLPLI